MPNYKISYTKPLTHFLKFSFELDSLNGDSAVLELPVWRPGRYEIQNFPKRIRNLKVTDASGETLSYQKLTKSRWLVSLEGNSSIVVTYEYYAGLMDAGNSWLDDEQVYVNPVNCCLYCPEQMYNEVHLEFDLPENYRIASGLQPDGEHGLKAKSYFQLVDSPVFASAGLRTVKYEVDGIEFYVHIQGNVPQSDEILIKDFEGFTVKQLEVMNGFPAKHYHFLIQSLPYKAYHGVEHWNSTVICLGPSSNLGERELYKELLGVSSHELFHTWNVIRLRPKEMTPYDFQGENYHQTGFVTEGVTTYYGDLFLMRSGVFSLEEYLSELNKLLKRHFENEGRKHYSVADSSFDLWLDGYEPGIPGRKVSIYNEGALAALILDLSIRLKFDNEKSLDDVMRLMWQRHGEDLSGYNLEDYRQAAEDVFGDDLSLYFEEVIHGVNSLDNYLKRLLESFGLSFGLAAAEKPEERLFGLRLNEGKVVMIAPDSPAEEMLSLGDMIESVNGVALSEQFPDVQTVTLKLNRMGVSKEIRLDAGDASFFNIYRVDLKSEPNGLLKGWLEL
ncbi:M61 family metallopeptidase [Roseivirga sp.]|uniref:M61 family metallopeptidase n=1 Tax=Roseivirga sp. TaxID=1964215 RepID=UPI003B52BD34